MNHTAPSPPSPARGRGLLASRQFRPGDIIAVFDDSASIAIPDSHHLDDTCSFCLLTTTAANTDTDTDSTATPPVKLRACTACRAASYCSPACQKRDWQHVHKLECKVFQRVRASPTGHGSKAVLPTTVRALVQILLLVHARPEAEGQALVGELQSHVEEFRRQDSGGHVGGKSGSSSSSGRSSAEAASWRDMQLQATAALHYLGRDGDEREKNRAMEILCKLQVNSFDRLDADVGQTGLFLHRQLAMVNHSCLPNAYVQFSGRAAVLRASQTIGKGQEVEISYIDQALPLSQRQASLEARYHFSCACPRCAQDMDVYEACRQYPDLHVNGSSLATDIKDILQRHLPSSSPSQNEQSLHETTANLQQRYHSSLPALPRAAGSYATTEQDLRKRWTLCQPILSIQNQAGTAKVPWATHPLPEILAEAAIYFSSSSRYASALSLCALQATHIEPVRNPFPNSPGRIKGLLMLAKLLANAAAPSLPSSSTSPSSSTAAAAAAAAAAEAPVRRVLDSMDVPTTCEVLLLFVLGSATALQDQQQQKQKEIQRYLVQPYHHDAQEMLADIHSLPGRERERASVQKLFQSYGRGENGSSGGGRGMGDVENRLFMDMVIVKPLQEIASLARGVMDAEFCGAVGNGNAGSGIFSSGLDIADQVD